MAYLNRMKWYLFLIPLLLILTAGCVGEIPQVDGMDSYSGVWVHDYGDPVFLFRFYPNGFVDIFFMGLEDPNQSDYPAIVRGEWEVTDQQLDITYTAPVSGNLRILHMKSAGDHLLLKGASAEGGVALDIENLEGIVFVRGESYSTPLMEHQSIDLV